MSKTEVHASIKAEVRAPRALDRLST